MKLSGQPPKVTVCVVTFNQEHYIRQCLQSIVSQQTDFDFTVIVADDCSTDGTLAVIQEFAATFPCMFQVENHERNIGAHENFIHVHNAARSDYVAHIDGDDLMLPGKLQAQVDFLDANPDFSVVWHRMNLFDDEGRYFPGEEYNLSMFRNGELTLEHALRLGSVSAHSSVMYRRSARVTREVDFPVLDLFFTWEYLMSGKGKILDAVLGEYRVFARNSIRGTINLRRLNAHHASFYLRRLPRQRKNIFIFALVNLAIDLKNRRSTAWEFAKLACASASLVSPAAMFAAVNEARHLVVHPLRQRPAATE